MPTTLTLDTRQVGVGGAAIAAALAVVPALPGHDAISCPLRSTTGIPCPFCGMTRGVGRLLLHGDAVGAVLLNPGSLLIVVAAAVLLLAVRRAAVRIPAWLPLAVVAALWTFQLAKFATGRPL